ncbi:3-ketoacyl-CoA thiolase [Coniophora puteana RWD-64-598 SS2]|uniref:3-ketoacyl-CoA thiolase n=1 Tax=Coniophora puteana (strain RWD-64-598) TaxID=741705 RepID=A0A5M3N6I4_CONPW|nr:3-ketoacyl-CoA thiolase [Coniophora puteana RWD-64-598 SS2]EIW86674.1 3-ketoacyl-CoA thiolase [Coniophora puteana RWD-64-598 SS2]
MSLRFLPSTPYLTYLKASMANPHSSRGIAHLVDKKPNDVVITYAKRTAMGRHRKGQFKDIPVDEMMQALFKASLQETRLDPKTIGDICVGTCHPPSPMYASRAAALAAGIPKDVPISTVNRLCSSGLMAIRSIAQSIQCGEISLGIAVGVENMSLNPRPTPVIAESVDTHTQAHDCIQPMGWTSEMVAQDYSVSRQKQDEYALISHTRATKAMESGRFSEEIVPVEIRGATISVDDTVRPGVTVESLSALKPVFPDWGSGATTAGNASGIGDGAALCIMTTRSRAEKDHMPIIAKYIGTTIVGVEPRHMGLGPIEAVPRILKTHSISSDDVDVYEASIYCINEAFASQFAYCVEELGLSMEKVNPNGGAIALTHPLGMTGIRQVVTGLAELRRTSGSILCTSMCVGSGMGAAGIFVNESAQEQAKL